MSGKYDDILNQEPPAPRRRAAMSMWDRAAQFSAFAALTGYEDVIAETGRLTQSPPELTSEALEELDQALHILLNTPDQAARICWFLPDPRKEGGEILASQGTLLHYDPNRETLLLSDGTRIPKDSVLGIEFV